MSVNTDFKMPSLFSKCREIQCEIEDELIAEAKRLADCTNAVDQDYCILTQEGIKKLRSRIWRAIPESERSSTMEGFVADTIIFDAERSFNSSDRFGGKLDRIIKGLPEKQPVEESKPSFAARTFSVVFDFSQLS